MELAWSVKELPRDRKGHKRSGSACREHHFQQELPSQQSLEPKMKNREGFPARDGCTSEKNVVIRNSGMSRPSCHRHRESNRSILHRCECQQRVETANRDDAVEAERLHESKRRKLSWVKSPAAVEQLRGAAKCTHLKEHEARPKMQGCQSLQDLTESRPVQSTHGEVMRLGEQTFCKLQLVRRASGRVFST